MLTLVVAVGGSIVNLGSVYVLQGGEMSLNERGAFYHLLGDAGGSIAVIVSTLAIAFFDVPVADPIAAIVIGLLVLRSAERVLKESRTILRSKATSRRMSLRRSQRRSTALRKLMTSTYGKCTAS